MELIDCRYEGYPSFEKVSNIGICKYCLDNITDEQENIWFQDELYHLHCYYEMEDLENE